MKDQKQMMGSSLMEWIMIWVIKSYGNTNIKHTAAIKEKGRIERRRGLEIERRRGHLEHPLIRIYGN
jgi:hypothetical protein